MGEAGGTWGAVPGVISLASSSQGRAGCDSVLWSQSEHVAGDKICSLPRLFGGACVLLSTWLCTGCLPRLGWSCVWG